MAVSQDRISFEIMVEKFKTEQLSDRERRSLQIYLDKLKAKLEAKLAENTAENFSFIDKAVEQLQLFNESYPAAEQWLATYIRSHLDAATQDKNKYERIILVFGLEAILQLIAGTTPPLTGANLRTLQDLCGVRLNSELSKNKSDSRIIYALVDFLDLRLVTQNYTHGNLQNWLTARFLSKLAEPPTDLGVDECKKLMGLLNINSLRWILSKIGELPKATVTQNLDAIINNVVQQDDQPILQADFLHLCAALLRKLHGFVAYPHLEDHLINCIWAGWERFQSDNSPISIFLKNVITKDLTQYGLQKLVMKIQKEWSLPPSPEPLPPELPPHRNMAKIKFMIDHLPRSALCELLKPPYPELLIEAGKLNRLAIADLEWMASLSEEEFAELQKNEFEKSRIKAHLCLDILSFLEAMHGNALAPLIENIKQWRELVFADLMAQRINLAKLKERLAQLARLIECANNFDLVGVQQTLTEITKNFADPDNEDIYGSPTYCPPCTVGLITSCAIAVACSMIFLILMLGAINILVPNPTTLALVLILFFTCFLLNPLITSMIVALIYEPITNVLVKPIKGAQQNQVLNMGKNLHIFLKSPADNMGQLAKRLAALFRDNQADIAEVNRLIKQFMARYPQCVVGQDFIATLLNTDSKLENQRKVLSGYIIRVEVLSDPSCMLCTISALANEIARIARTPFFSVDTTKNAEHLKRINALVNDYLTTRGTANIHREYGSEADFKTKLLQCEITVPERSYTPAHIETLQDYLAASLAQEVRDNPEFTFPNLQPTPRLLVAMG